VDPILDSTSKCFLLIGFFQMLATLGDSQPVYNIQDGQTREDAPANLSQLGQHTQPSEVKPVSKCFTSQHHLEHLKEQYLYSWMRSCNRPVCECSQNAVSNHATSEGSSSTLQGPSMPTITRPPHSTIQQLQSTWWGKLNIKTPTSVTSLLGTPPDLESRALPPTCTKDRRRTLGLGCRRETDC
jgi:hypothetical protein